MTTQDVFVTARATLTDVELSITAPYSGNGAAVSYSTASVRASLLNRNKQYDLWYRIDSGAWQYIPAAGTAHFDIDFSTQTLTLKLGEFSGSPIALQMSVQGVPSGFYAEAATLTPSLTQAAIEAAGGLTKVFSVELAEDLVALIPTADNLSNNNTILLQPTAQEFGTGVNLNGGNGTGDSSAGGDANLSGGDSAGTADGAVGGRAQIFGGNALDAPDGAGGNVVLRPGAGGAANGELIFVDGNGGVQMKLDLLGRLLLFNIPGSSAGLPSGALYTTAGALMLVP